MMNFEEKASDLMITWTMPIHENHYQLPPPKYIGIKKKKFSCKNKDLLILGIDMPRYTFRCQINPGSGQIFLHYNQTIQLFYALRKSVQQNFKVRPYHVESGWGIRHKYEKDLGLNHLSKGSYDKVIAKARLVVCTYQRQHFPIVLQKLPHDFTISNAYELHPKMQPLLKL